MDRSPSASEAMDGLERPMDRSPSAPGRSPSAAKTMDGRERPAKAINGRESWFSLVLSWSFHAAERRLHAVTVPHQTMKALMPIFVLFAFFVFFASLVVESLRS